MEEHLAGRGAPGISVVVTVRDDSDELAALLSTLPGQSRRPDEVIVVDGSPDSNGTASVLQRWQRQGDLPLKVIQAPGSNISEGRNIGVRAARHEKIACTDAGCRPGEGWLAALDAALDEVDFAGGVYRLHPATPFEWCVTAALYPSPDEVGARSVVGLSHRLFGRAFALEGTTGRSMGFRRSAWEAAAGFPESLYAGEDVAFSAAVLSSGVAGRLVPGAEVAWRPRPGWRATARMFAIYARGGVRRHPRRYVIRGLAWGSLVPLVRFGAPARAAVTAGAAAYLTLPLIRARRWGVPLRQLWRLPLLVALKDLAQCVGAAQGVGDLIARRPQPTPRRR